MDMINFISNEELVNPEPSETLKVGARKPLAVKLWRRDLLRMEELFGELNTQLKNASYPALVTIDPEGRTVDLYFRRVIADFFLVEQGLPTARGYTVEVIDGDPGNLRRENLRLVFNKDLAERGKQQRRNSGVASDVIRLRSNAINAGLCPDKAIALAVGNDGDKQ